MADYLTSTFPASPRPTHFRGCFQTSVVARDFAGDVHPPASRRLLNPPAVQSPEVARWPEAIRGGGEEPWLWPWET